MGRAIAQSSQLPGPPLVAQHSKGRYNESLTSDLFLRRLSFNFATLKKTEEKLIGIWAMQSVDTRHGSNRMIGPISKKNVR